MNMYLKDKDSVSIHNCNASTLLGKIVLYHDPCWGTKKQGITQIKSKTGSKHE